MMVCEDVLASPIFMCRLCRLQSIYFSSRKGIIDEKFNPVERDNVNVFRGTMT